MIVKNKEKFIRRLFLYKHLKLINYETNIDDKELIEIIKVLNIKNNFTRKEYILEKTCDYIDNYYKSCNTCKFKNNKCICHRNLNKDYINGCCRKCKYQSNKGCKTKNIACKLFYCTHADLGNKKRLEIKDLPLLKILNPVERFIVSNDYFRSIEEVLFDLYLWPALVLILFAVQTLLVMIK